MFVAKLKKITLQKRLNVNANHVNHVNLKALGHTCIFNSAVMYETKLQCEIPFSQIKSN